MADEPTVERRDLDWSQAFGWFKQNVDDLDMLMPHEIEGTDRWTVTDPRGSVVGLAIVDPDYPAERESDERVAWVHRIGVQDERQGEGFGRLLLERIRDEYGPIELEVDSRKPANGFYEAIGMDLVAERYAVMNDGSEGTLNVWRLD